MTRRVDQDEPAARRASRTLRWPSFWDLAYAAGDHLLYWDPPATPPELVELLDAGLIPRQGTVVDLGCGAGREAVFCAGRGHPTLALDRSLPALLHARRRARDAGASMLCCQADVFAPPLAAGCADLVLDRGLFHLLPRRRRPAYARRIGRLLRPGGHLLLRFAAGDDPEAGLVTASEAELDRLFPQPGFHRHPPRSITMTAQAEDLPAQAVLIRRRARRAEPAGRRWSPAPGKPDRRRRPRG